VIPHRDNQLVWVSHSSIGDFLKCPRSYFLRNMYKSKTTNRKMTIMSPPLALGQAVHETLESLSSLPQAERFKKPLSQRYLEAWEKVAGKKGGFRGPEQEAEYKERGANMIIRILDNPGILLNKTIKIKNKDFKPDFDLPHFRLSPADNIELCGKIDWVEYIDADDSIHIVDFKTGKNEEDENSLQLLIYYLLAKNLQKRAVSKMSYWYIDRDITPKQAILPTADEASERVMEAAKRIKLARQLNLLNCSTNGCNNCLPYEAILRGSGELVGVSETNQDIYILK